MARKILFSLVAVAFAGIALGNLFVPDAMAEGLGQTLSNVDARNEHRAIYVGLWAAHVIIFAWAAGKPDDRTLYVVCVLLLGGQVLGRAVSLALDGMPSSKMIPVAVVEAAGLLALLFARPGPRQGTSSNAAP